MPRRVSTSSEQIQWLKDAKRKGVSYLEMSKYIGCCEDTLKRILVRYDIATFSSEKYNAIAFTGKQWQRPCNICRCTKSRPRFQFTCDSCHEQTNVAADWAAFA
ncbi:hypothetical protein UFOVP235_45 [uncultured Caudovirales phage]|uniref:Uncharacterized protein n=1 Tax=uncultured Caudovirales phage TaxID=2100421 RepID=A0A6J7WZB5_9CAUD|nr:hypothetical protein UFOVP235_45 [uncultured Caudovirales phage]